MLSSPTFIISQFYTCLQQVDNLRKHVCASGISKSVELVVVSPLLRTMQTAVGAFGGEGSADGSDVPPLMAEDTSESNRPAISSQNCTPFIVVKLCREHLALLIENLALLIENLLKDFQM